MTYGERIDELQYKVMDGDKDLLFNYKHNSPEYEARLAVWEIERATYIAEVNILMYVDHDDIYTDDHPTSITDAKLYQFNKINKEFGYPESKSLDPVARILETQGQNSESDESAKSTFMQTLKDPLVKICLVWFVLSTSFAVFHAVTLECDCDKRKNSFSIKVR